MVSDRQHATDFLVTKFAQSQSIIHWSFERQRVSKDRQRNLGMVRFIQLIAIEFCNHSDSSTTRMKRRPHLSMSIYYLILHTLGMDLSLTLYIGNKKQNNYPY